MNVQSVEQPIGEGYPYGTGYAVMAAENYIDDEETVLILCADGPLVKKETLIDFMNYHFENNCAASIMTAYLDNPRGYGRIVRKSDMSIDEIVEEKDASEEIKNIKEINTGIYCFKGELLKYALKKITKNNSQNEYYLTDTIKVLNNEGANIGGWLLEDSDDIKAVNDRVQLAEVTKIMQKRINQRHMYSGVTIIDPDSTYIDDSVKIGRDTVIYPNTYLEGGTVIGSNCTIGPNSRIIDSTVRNNVTVESSKVIESYIDDGTNVGPFAYLRPGSNLGKNVKIGDFVTLLGSGVGHDAVIGDYTTISSYCDITGGVKIGKKVFIGSHVTIVPNRIIGDEAYIGAGSVVIGNVKEKTKVFGNPARKIS
jgi:bifunctional UDP-N-acetylglucosamine pyrophosphorylase/glucosamine-1-phosphate N-acetyltransferase